MVAGVGRSTSSYRPPTKAIRVNRRSDYMREDPCREIYLDMFSRGYTRGLLMRTAR